MHKSRITSTKKTIMAEKTYHVISPDGFPLTLEPFQSKRQAREFIPLWLKRYEQQGYYSAVTRRIPLDELRSYLRIVPSEEAIHAFDGELNT